MSEEILHFKKYILTLERFPQRDFIKREGIGVDQNEAVTTILDKFFSEHKTQKVKLVGCIEILDRRKIHENNRT